MAPHYVHLCVVPDVTEMRRDGWGRPFALLPAEGLVVLWRSRRFACALRLQGSMEVRS